MRTAWLKKVDEKFAGWMAPKALHWNIIKSILKNNGVRSLSCGGGEY